MYQGRALIRVPKPRTAAVVVGGIITLFAMLGCLTIIMAM